MQAHLCQELAGNCLQSLLGPSSEPVNGCVVDQSREVPTACLESLSNGRHTQDNVQVSSTLFDEVGPHTLSGGLHTCLHGLITNLIHTYMYKLNPGRLVHMYMCRLHMLHMLSRITYTCFPGSHTHVCVHVHTYVHTCVLCIYNVPFRGPSLFYAQYIHTYTCIYQLGYMYYSGRAES